jgi:probable HAF family extracellular repeat protein
MSDLTELLGSCCSIGFAINNAGQITGSFVSPNNDRAFVYSRTQILFIGSLGRNGSSSYGINDTGQVVGLSQVADGAFHAFVYGNGQIEDLNSPVDLDPDLHATLL